ncbi:MAG: Crp/Fnr family transcriptional regulator [Myxococcaceae bacterium]|nr:Crp/Fnr family transcriptional regulator [Myxococcaceae bacterium]
MSLRATLERLAPVDAASVGRALADFTPLDLATGEHLLVAGQRATKLAFIERGLVREYYVSAGGEEHVRSFCAEGTFTGSLYDLLSGADAITHIEALEPCRLWVAEWAHFQARCEREPGWHVAGRRIAEALYQRKVVREHQMLALTATERLEALRRELPHLERRVKARHVASYLGITPEHLSRVRAAPRRAPTSGGRSTGARPRRRRAARR